MYLNVGKMPRKEGMNRVLAISAIAAVASAHSAATPAKWHQARRAAILKAHPEVKDLIGRSSSTLPLLAVTNGLQVASCVAASHLPTPALVPLAILGGGAIAVAVCAASRCQARHRRAAKRGQGERRCLLGLAAVSLWVLLVLALWPPEPSPRLWFAAAQGALRQRAGDL